MACYSFEQVGCWVMNFSSDHLSSEFLYQSWITRYFGWSYPVKQIRIGEISSIINLQSMQIIPNIVIQRSSHQSFRNLAQQNEAEVAVHKFGADWRLQFTVVYEVHNFSFGGRESSRIVRQQPCIMEEQILNGSVFFSMVIIFWDMLNDGIAHMKDSHIYKLHNASQSTCNFTQRSNIINGIISYEG